MRATGKKLDSQTRTTTGKVTRTAVRLQNNTKRAAATRAESWLDSDESLEWDEVSSELDDAPTADDLPEWEPEDEDDVVQPDDVRPWELPGGTSEAWTRMSIFESRDGFLDYEVLLRWSGDPDIDRSLAEIWSKWNRLGQNLVRMQPKALRTRTLYDALHALEPHAMADIETSEGQGSRDRTDLIETPFGVVPLWFFGLGRLVRTSRSLLVDLENVAAVAKREGWTRITEGMVSKALPRIDTPAGTISRRHGATVLAVLSHPDTVAKHRSSWPMTTLEALSADLGEVARVGVNSQAVLALALVGAFGESNEVPVGSDSMPEFPDDEESTSW